MKPYERLLEHNIKPSMQRIAIMEYLMNHPIHPSADDIISFHADAFEDNGLQYFEIVFGTGGCSDAYD